MYMEIPLLTKCCLCIPLRCGLLTWAYLRLIFSIFGVGWILLTLLAFEMVFGFNSFIIGVLVLILSTLMLFIFDIVFDIVLIVGCHKKHTTFLRLYFRFGIAYAIIFVMFIVAIVAFKLAIDSNIINDIEDLAVSWNFITILSSVCGTLLILHMYLLLMVHSEITRLKQPSSQFQFVNRIAVPSRIKEVDSLSKDNKKVLSSEKPLPSTLAGSNNDWLYIDNKNFSI